MPGRWLIGAIGASACAVLALMGRAQLHLDSSDLIDRLFAIAVIAGAIARVALWRRGSRRACVARDMIDHVGMFALICLVGALASYPVAADTIGFDDAALERGDRLLRFDWVRWYDVVAAHPSLQIAGGIAYQSIFVTPAILLGYFALSGRRAEARLFIASFWLAALMTLLLFTLTPAEGPLAYLWHGRIPYMPASALYQETVIPLLRRHAVHDVSVKTLHGLVCAPSFHTVSAVLYVIAAWPVRRLRWPLLAVNVAMLLATPVEGTHYLTDMVMGALVALVASLVVRQWLPSLAVREPDPLRRTSEGELLRLLSRETVGPGATAILAEIDRRGME